jgi:hypothetical protein
MEKQMQEYITKGNYSICREIDKICSEHYEFCNENQNKNSASKIQIYYDYGNGFSETNSNIINATLLNDKYYFDATIPYGLQNVRIDIGNQGCILDDISIQIIDTDGKRSRVDIKTVAHNGEYINNKIYILNDDPQLVLENLTKKSKEIVMEYKYTTIELEIIDIYNSEKNKLSKVEKDYSELLRVSDERFLTLSNKIDNYRLEIDNIHSSSSWKITKPLRAIKKIIYKQ